jgi:HSP20 family protein
MASQPKKRVADEDAFVELPHKLNGTGGTALRLDAYETGGIIEMTAEVPGVPQSAIDVSIDGDILTISVEKMNCNAGKRVHFAERAFGRFERSIQLPFVPDPGSVDAAAENGLLTIRFPRVDTRRTHRIALRGAETEPRPHSQPDSEPEEQKAAIGSDWDEMMPTGDGTVTVEVTATRLS